MKRQALSVKQIVVQKVLRGKLTKREASKILDCTPQTIYRYIEKVAAEGLEGLMDHRRSNNRKLTSGQIVQIIKDKKTGLWRSARKVLERTGITMVSERQVQRIWVKHGLSKINLTRLKPIVRFVAKAPNDLWQQILWERYTSPILVMRISLQTLMTTQDSYWVESGSHGKHR